MVRNLLLSLLVFLFVFQASATVFGTFPQQLEKQSDDLSSEISLGMINAGDSDLVVEFSSPDDSEYNISLPENVVLESSAVSSRPEGSGWYYLGNNKYAEYEEFSFPVEISEYRKNNRIDIPLRITARSGEQSGTSPVSRFREYNYTVFLNPNLRPLDRQGDVRDKPLYWEEESSVPDEWKEADESSENEQKSSENSSNQSQNYKASGTDELTGETGENSTFTLVLAAGIVLTTAYIIKVT
jgi:hypothetical protein